MVNVTIHANVKLDDTEIDLLELYDKADHIEVTRRIRGGKSSAKVVLADIRFNDPARKQYEGSNYIKIDTARDIDFETERHQLALQNGLAGAIPPLIDKIMLDANRAAVIYHPAGGKIKGAYSLGQLASGENDALDLVEASLRQLGQILTQWNPPERIAANRRTMSAYTWFERIVSCGSRTNGRLNELETLAQQTGTADVPQPPELPPRQQVRLWLEEAQRALFNPVAFALRPELWPDLDITGPVGHVHGDLHGGNLICHDDPNVLPSLIDFARYESDAPIFFDLAYLELDLLIRRLSSVDWAVWRDTLAFLTTGVVPPRRPRLPMSMYAWETVRPVREHVQQIINAGGSDNLLAEFEPLWWLTTFAVGVVFTRRESYLNRPERSMAFLYTAFALQKTLDLLGYQPVEREPRAYPTRLTRSASTILPALEEEYANRLLEAYTELTAAYVPLEVERRRKQVLSRARTEHARYQTPLSEVITVPPGDRQTPSLRNLADILARDERLVLVGDPGSGKTTTLKHLAVEYAQRLLTTPQRLIPVFVPLASYRGTSEADFTAFVQQQVANFSPRLSKMVEALMEQERLILLCDALNEMPRDDLLTLTSLKRSLSRGGVRWFVISCRQNDYRSKELSDIGYLPVVQIRYLTPPLIQQMIRKYVYEPEPDMWVHLSEDEQRTLWEQEMQGSDDLLQAWDEMSRAGLEAEFWQDADPPGDVLRLDGAGRLLDDRDSARRRMLRNPKGLMQLCRTPYMLSIVIQLYRENNLIAVNRGALFADFVDTLFQRERDEARQWGEVWPDDTKARLDAALVKLAELMQLERGVTDISHAEAVAAMRDAKLLQLALRCRLLQEQSGQKIRFAHQLLQEYFASQRMGVDMDRGVPAAHYWPPDHWWEPSSADQTARLLAGARANTAGSRGLLRVLHWVAMAQPRLALECLLEIKGEVVLPLHPWLRRALLPGIRTKMRAESPIGRALAWSLLGLLGEDRRRGIGVNRDGLPVIEWCEVPAGPFMYQMGRRIELPTFYISRYPITLAQYAAFAPYIRADHGSTDVSPDDLIETDFASALESISLSRAEAPRLGNYPYNHANWINAQLFCDWYSKASGLPVRLPHEYEWEKAARGTDGRLYPFGSHFNPNIVNWHQAGLGHECPVGIFPEAMSPYGVLDMAGNIYEWCLAETRSDPKPPTRKSYILRGGAWPSPAEGVQVTWRSIPSDNRLRLSSGFRLVTTQPPR